MMNLELASVPNLIGYTAYMLTLVSFQLLKQKDMFAVRVVADLTWALHWFLLGGLTATLTLLIAAVRTFTIVFIKPSWKTYLIPTSVVLIFILTILAPIEGWIKYLPWVASTCMAVSLYYHDDFIKCRSIMMVGGIIWIISALLLGSFPALVSMITIVLSHGIGMVRYVIKIKNRSNP